ncbi:MAG TPA: hypothetical protein VGH89_17845 [Pseudonocardia sp.]|jgi:hypothetical protein
MTAAPIAAASGDGAELAAETEPSELDADHPGAASSAARSTARVASAARRRWSRPTGAPLSSTTKNYLMVSAGFRGMFASGQDMSE